ncbi:hypothetical protein KPH14_007039 [Odynerus spinipes]|uniref:Uncharacterized protein n=1 Tax=Odynerus spinipes TaxID=1348599 RepID=A0AAD9VSR2_9HYME|nr:hypothetical protein KPH14_007039 [Odynerus spinipes]
MCDYCSWIQQILARINVEAKQLQERIPPPRVDPVIIVHGGAGRITKDKCSFMLEEVKDAAVKAYNDLIQGYTAVDAIEIAISRMEDTLYTNYKDILHINDDIVMDASIMTNNLNAGCVGVVRGVEHPIKLAREVLEHTDHVIIVEKGAQKLAKDAHIPILPQKYLLRQFTPSSSASCTYRSGEEECVDPNSNTDDSSDKSVSEDDKERDTECKREEISMIKNYLSECHFLKPEPEEMEGDIYDEELRGSDSFISIHKASNTVGAVAYDRKRCLSSGVSTMGQSQKIVGSMSAIGTVVGCGIYADENGCCSVSGDNTSIYKYAPAYKIVRRFNSDTTAMLELNEELERFEKETGDSEIGAIALNAKGEPSVSFRSMNFPWACCQNGYIYYGCKQNDKFCHEIKNLSRPLDCMCEKPA